jgi:3-deoxy-7-phosphoheptulonate synthase
MGLLLESNLHPGKQTWQAGLPLKHGVSITDACLDWPETRELLYEAAATVEERNAAAARRAAGA